MCRKTRFWIWPWWSASRHPFLPGRIGGDGARRALEAQAKVQKKRISLVNKSQVHVSMWFLSIGCRLLENRNHFTSVQNKSNVISTMSHQWACLPEIKQTESACHELVFRESSSSAVQSRHFATSRCPGRFWTWMWKLSKVSDFKKRSRRIIAAPSTTASTRRIHKGCGTRGIRDLCVKHGFAV